METPVSRPEQKVTFRVSPTRGRSQEVSALWLERRLEELDGVTDAEASFHTGLIHVELDPELIEPRAVGERIQALGIELDDGVEPIALEDIPTHERTLRIEALFVALTFTGMTVGLIAGWFDLPTEVSWIGYGVAYVFGGYYGLKASIETLRHLAVDIDLLMILAATGALIIGAPFEGAMLLFLFSLSNVLQHYAFGRSRRAIRSLMELRPESAQVLLEGKEVTRSIDEVELGDIFVIRPGDRIPLDGVVVDGESTVDQASLTGESVPVAKSVDDQVFSGTINETGRLEVEVTRLAHESAIARLIHLVEEAQSEKAPTQRLIDRFEQPYVIGVFAMTALAIAIPLSLGFEFDSTFYRAMTLMVAASPCAVIISTPAAVLSAITAGARQGVLFKGGEYVESIADVDVVALDKTGTLTEGNTRLTDAVVRSDDAEETRSQADLLALAAAVQSGSEHHLAEATVDAARERELAIPSSSRFQARFGKGVYAEVDGSTIHIGNPRYFEDDLVDGPIAGLDEGLDAVNELQREGKTSVLVVRETEGHAAVIGWLAYSDTIRQGAAEMIEELRRHGVERVIMVTGDNEVVAQAIAEEVGIDEVRAELLPEQKVEIIEELTEQFGSVVMVGDGVNDAPALAVASIGVAMGGAGTDVALETADIVLMGDDLTKLPYVLELGSRTRRTLMTNFGVAFGAIGIMVAAIIITGMPLPLAVVGHEGSTVAVSLNGLRLLGFRS